MTKCMCIAQSYRMNFTMHIGKGMEREYYDIRNYLAIQHAVLFTHSDQQLMWSRCINT